MSSELNVHPRRFVRQWPTTACNIQFAQHFCPVQIGRIIISIGTPVFPGR